MEWVISHQSVLEFWRKAPAKEALAKKALQVRKLSDELMSAKILLAKNPCKLSAPIHVLVGSANARNVTRNLVCHVTSSHFPRGSFIQVESGLVASSPELCFLQMAGTLSLIELIKLGFEFCGYYRLDDVSSDSHGFRADQALTNISKLKAYVAASSNVKGIKNARRALQYIANGSASPMETILVMLLILPYQLGGCGFSMPSLNHPVDVSHGAGRSSRYYCDLFWASEKVDVEYDSDIYHTGADRIARDGARRNALSSVGVTAIVVSKMQIMNVSRFREVAEVLGRLLGKQLKYPMPEFVVSHNALRSQLLSHATTETA
jgi:hypothetical protein